MKVLYVYSNCSKRKYDLLFHNSEVMILQQAQKYHSLLINGINDNDIEVTCISGLPINRHYMKSVWIKKESEKIDGIRYIYYTSLNLPIFRQLCIFINGFLKTVNFCRKNKDAVIICDILNIANSSGALLASKICRRPSVGIVTDVPGVLADNSRMQVGMKKLKNDLLTKINQFILYRFSSYVFLTAPMNNLINKENRPFVVLEGHANIRMREEKNILSDKYDNKVIIYAGSLKKIYGIKMLTESFIKANVENSELHIYGDGDFNEELHEICMKYNNIKYFGIKLNDYIVKEQLKATLLVNPRPTNEKYTKYSFPSKNLEYMASGTPTLTTKLPGMPIEYNNYVYLIEEETMDGLALVLKEILSKSKQELHDKGYKAKQFILKEKNNVIQAHKIIEMMKEL